uniref:Uncharacterized protein n=1 Tax=Anguilla anguilla TaxID=7936 RepID=A0A0E9PD42_ANGAN
MFPSWLAGELTFFHYRQGIQV